ncbi:hypothetical protein [Gordonibacter sp. 28C]|uniref:hypothetical protein n=1 Tax=Gordonibacter sp. 28C TaxID=2078569 RepID=UPI0018F752D9|nr:hypothetical protein [Gordonibacter sp. 28C]
MCFRPAAASTENLVCPKCGTSNPPGSTKCQGCGASAQDLAGAVPAPGVPQAPGAPKAPGAPGAPGMPKPSGAPRA